MNRRLAMILATEILLIASMPGRAEENAVYPMKPVRLIVPATAGSAPDLIARFIADPLAGALKQPVVIENKPGASGVIGLQVVAGAAPDGHTLGILAVPYVVAPSLTPKMPYNIEKDLVAVTLLTWNYPILAVPASSTAHSIAELVSLAKANPARLTYASSGNASPGHLGMELFKRQADVSITHIPYRGNPAAVAAVLAGDVNLMVGGAGALAPHLKSGKLRALATAAPERMAAYPDLPTLVELGYPAVKVSDWLGVVAPRGTPPFVIDRLQSALLTIVKASGSKQRLEAIGMEPAGEGAEYFAAFIQAEIQRWNKVVRDAKISAD